MKNNKVTNEKQIYFQNNNDCFNENINCMFFLEVISEQ